MAIQELARLVSYSGEGQPWWTSPKFSIFSFNDDTFNTTFISTIGIDFKIKNVEVQGKKIKLQIWDTTGQERFHTITKSYYRYVSFSDEKMNWNVFSGANGILLVYDYTNPKSFDNLPKWLENINEHAPKDAICMLIGEFKFHLKVWTEKT